MFDPHETQQNRTNLFLSKVNITSHISFENLQSKKHNEEQTEGGTLADGCRWLLPTSGLWL